MKSLLIADDERIIREGIAGSLDWESLSISRVLVATDGKEAYEIITKEKPDIVIIDIIMPEMTGIEVISRFSKQAVCPEFIIISGYEEFQYAQEAIRYNVNNYLLKPCDPVEIESTIKQVLSKIEQRRLLAQEQMHLKEYVSILMPQAREQILRDFLVSNSPTSRKLFAQMFDECCSEFQMLLFSVADPDDYAKLRTFKAFVDALPITGWRISALVRDCVVLVFDAKRETEIREKLGSVQKRELDGIRGVISGTCAMDMLPQSYKDACEVGWRVWLSRIDRGREIVPIIDIGVAQYSEPIRKALKYIRGNIGDSSLSLQHIALNVLYLNPDYLGKLFKKECGIKFSDYLMMLRIEKAKKILAKSMEVKIYEVAQQVGLGDSAAYFGQVFRKYTGMLPSEYKEKYGKK